MINRLLCIAGIFFTLFVVFFPLDFLGGFQNEITSFVFRDLTEWIAVNLFMISHARIDFSSDSISMYILIGLLLVISIVFGRLIRKKYHVNILCFSKEITVIYLAVVLMKYGFDKIFKAQFYLPEPNILYSRFGNLDRDILFWSTMGTSRFYSVFSGALELTTVLLLIFNKTRTLGLLISVGIFINILAINFGFDISVKLFSLILLFMVIFTLKDEWVRLYQFLILKKERNLARDPKSNMKTHPIWVFFKTAFLSLSLVMVLFPYVNSGNFNDDTSERPFIHGAFKNVNQTSDIQYVFFHRNGYLILMDKNERMQDFHYSWGASKKSLLLEDHWGKRIYAGFSYQKKDRVLIMKIGEENIRAKELDWRKMKALQPLFHRVIEEVK